MACTYTQELNKNTCVCTYVRAYSFVRSWHRPTYVAKMSCNQLLLIDWLCCQGLLQRDVRPRGIPSSRLYHIEGHGESPLAPQEGGHSSRSIHQCTDTYTHTYVCTHTHTHVHYTMVLLLPMHIHPYVESCMNLDRPTPVVPVVQRHSLDIRTEKYVHTYVSGGYLQP